MHPCLRTWVAIRCAVMYYAQAAHAFTAEIECLHCTYIHTYIHTNIQTYIHTYIHTYKNIQTFRNITQRYCWNKQVLKYSTLLTVGHH